MRGEVCKWIPLFDIKHQGEWRKSYEEITTIFARVGHGWVIRLVGASHAHIETSSAEDINYKRESESERESNNSMMEIDQTRNLRACACSCQTVGERKEQG